VLGFKFGFSGGFVFNCKLLLDSRQYSKMLPILVDFLSYVSATGYLVEGSGVC